MYVVYVQDKDGNPLDPTTRFGKVRRMLKDERAIVVRSRPFTIRLQYEPGTKIMHSYTGCTDPGRKNIGNAVLENKTAAAVYRDHVITRNDEIPDLMSDRKKARQASRRGERLRRKRRAGKYNTSSTKLDNGRVIPGCEKATEIRDIINTEARFANRKKKRLITPTVNQLVETHLNHVDQICSLYPVTDWAVEINKFAFMRMEDGSVWGVDFQNGRMKGYKTVEDYVFALQNGKCACCGEPLKDVHHIIPRNDNGSDGPENRIGLCDGCHHKVHTGNLKLDKVGQKQKYGALSVLNQAIPYILKGLIERFGEDHVHTCMGYETNDARELFGLGKQHDVDAICIGAIALGKEPVIKQDDVMEIAQFRRQDRAIIKCQRERTYKLDIGEVDKKGRRTLSVLAKNRRPRKEQQGDSLESWFEKAVKKNGRQKAERMRSQMTVIPSKRSYNRREKERIMPGATFKHNGKRYVLKKTAGNGFYFYPYDVKNDKGNQVRFKANECTLLTKNSGLVYL